MKKRIFSLLLALCLVAGMLPTVAYAYDNTGTIDSGEFNEDVNNRGTINGGTFNKAVTNSGTINNGEFNNTVTNTPGSYINNGTFNGIINNYGGGSITGGTFNNTVNNNAAGNYILGGTFNATVNNNSGAKIQGGAFNGTVNNNGTAKIQDGTFYSTVNNNADSDINSGTFYGDVENNGTITGGTFYGAVSGTGTIRDSAKVTVTFDSDNGNTVQEEKVLRGQKASAPTAPTKAGYSFDGWYNGDDLYDFNTPVTENITLTAKWSVVWTELTKAVLESPTYKVESLGAYIYRIPSGNYYLGENISLDKRIDIGDKSTVNNVILDLNGYELRKDNNTVLLFLQNDSTLTVMDSSVTKTGKIISNYAITFNDRGKFNANGGTIEGDVYISGDNAIIDNTDPSNVAVFRNGQINGAYPTAIINGGIFYSTVSYYIGRITGGTFYGTVSDGTIEDSAKVTVTFDSDGGSTVTEQKVLRGQKATAPTEPTKTGYSFNGWYNGNTPYDFANTPVTENITLTAKWAKVVTATISAIPDETYTGRDIEPAITVYDGETVIPASEYTVSYSDNRNAGTATVTLTDKTGGNYVVSGSTTFEILPKSISDAVFTLNGALIYNGTEQTQNVTVTLAGFDAVTFDVSGNKQTDVNVMGNHYLMLYK